MLDTAAEWLTWSMAQASVEVTAATRRPPHPAAGSRHDDATADRRDDPDAAVAAPVRRMPEPCRPTRQAGQAPRARRAPKRFVAVPGGVRAAP